MPFVPKNWRFCAPLRMGCAVLPLNVLGRIGRRLVGSATAPPSEAPLENWLAPSEVFALLVAMMIWFLDLELTDSALIRLFTGNFKKKKLARSAGLSAGGFQSGNFLCKRFEFFGHTLGTEEGG